MAPKILIPTALKQYTGQKDTFQIDGKSVGEVLARLTTDFSTLKQHLYGADGKLRSFVNVYVNDEDIRFLQGDQTAVKNGDEVSIIPAIAGG